MTDVSADAYLERMREVVDRVSEQRTGPVQEAADLLTAALQAGGVIQAFGSGHSEALAMEVAGRAGGLIPTNRLALRDVVLRGGEPVSVIAEGTLERDPDVAARVYALADPRPEDAFVIASSSGVNGSIVEMAGIVKEHGHPLVAITSLAHTAAVASRHPSGRKLVDLADVVLDNGAPVGDAMLEMPGGGTVGAVSSITAAMLAQLVTTEVVRRLIEAGETPPVYISANVPGGDEHNRELEARYAGRLRRGA